MYIVHYTGKADPYCVISYEEEESKTKVHMALTMYIVHYTCKSDPYSVISYEEQESKTKVNLRV